VISASILPFFMPRPLAARQVEADEAAERRALLGVAAEELHDAAGVVGDAQEKPRSVPLPDEPDAPPCPALAARQHLLHLPHHRVDELLLDADHQARQGHRRAGHVVGPHLVAGVGRLGAVDGGLVGELRDQGDQQRQHRDGDQQGHAALAVALVAQLMPSPEGLPEPFHCLLGR
jgi:hypothetical protein